MVGIDVGATRVTLSRGSSTSLHVQEYPLDLLTRVAENRPIITTSALGCDIAAAHDVFARTVARVVEQHRLREPSVESVALAVPGWWTKRTLARVESALGAVGVTALLVNDAEASVTETLASGHSLPETVAVVSLRTTHVSVVIVRQCLGNPTATPSPVLVHDEGGLALDAAVLRHLVRGVIDLGEAVDVDDPVTIEAARSALTQARWLREALSMTSTESVVPELPGVSNRIRVVRSELDELAEPWIQSTIDLVSTAVEHATERVSGVLLTGGLAAMPLVSQRISAELGLPVHVPASPHLVAARGAARALALHGSVQHRPGGLRKFLQERVPWFRPRPEGGSQPPEPFRTVGVPTTPRSAPAPREDARAEDVTDDVAVPRHTTLSAHRGLVRK